MPAAGFSEGRWIGSFSHLGTTDLGGASEGAEFRREQRARRAQRELGDPLHRQRADRSFIANRAIDGDFATSGQRLQQAELDLLISIDEGGPIPVNAIGLYLQDAETVMGESTERDSTCDDGTFRRFNTAALSLGDAIVSVCSLGSRSPPTTSCSK